jgi:hypothetical protein
MENDCLPLAQVRAGMVLATDLRDKGGHVLLPAGTTLTQALLDRLAGQGIDTVPVHGDARLDYLFRRLDPTSPDAWAARALKDHLRAWRAGAGE